MLLDSVTCSRHALKPPHEMSKTQAAASPDLQSAARAAAMRALGKGAAGADDAADRASKTPAKVVFC